MNKSALADENKRLSIENGMYLRVMNDWKNGSKPDAAIKLAGAEKHTYWYGELWRAKSADGGICIISYEHANGELDARIYSIEALERNLRDNHEVSTLGLRIVLAKLLQERNRIAGY